MVRIGHKKANALFMTSDLRSNFGKLIPIWPVLEFLCPLFMSYSPSPLFLFVHEAENVSKRFPVTTDRAERSPKGEEMWAVNTKKTRVLDYESDMDGRSELENGARAILTHEHAPCQSRSDKWPTTTGWAAGGSAAKKQRKTDGTRKPA